MYSDSHQKYVKANIKEEFVRSSRPLDKRFKLCRKFCFVIQSTLVVARTMKRETTVSLISSPVRTSRNNYSGWLFAHSVPRPRRCVYISDEVRICHKYSGEAVYLFRVGPRPKHMLSETPTAPSPQVSPSSVFFSFFLGRDEAVNPVLGSPEIHRIHRRSPANLVRRILHGVELFDT